MADYRNMLVTTDFSDAALPGVQEAARLADRLGSRIVLLYVVEDRLPPVILATSGFSRDQILEEHREKAEERLAEYARQHLGDRAVEHMVRVGVSHDEILRTAAERRVDLIVMATHGYGLMGHMLFGSTTERVLHHAECPVVVIRSHQG